MKNIKKIKINIQQTILINISGEEERTDLVIALHDTYKNKIYIRNTWIPQFREIEKIFLGETNKLGDVAIISCTSLNLTVV
jgi:hypothetical protein